METTKICNRLRNLSNDLKTSCAKDIINILDIIFEEYDIVYKNTDQIVKKQVLTNRLRELLNENIQDEISICRGFSQNGNKCFKRSQQNSNYCKVHAYLAFRENTTNNILSIGGKVHSNLIEQIELNKNHNTNKKPSLEKTFIKDSFYYYDKRFIYDSDSLDKVGYIDETQGFVLTDDPFILEIL
jgi:hypothetical protein